MNARQPRLGFTLIELLVVIAIIAILAAILFPVFVNAKASAKKATCQTHQHELCSALSMYTEAYGGRMPYRQFLSLSDISALGGKVGLYRPYVKNDDIILCPVENRYTYFKNSLKVSGVGHQAYAYNECLIGDLNGKQETGTEAYFVSPFYAETNSSTGRMVGSICYASKTPAFFDAYPCEQSAGLPPSGWGWQPIDSTDQNRMTNPHSNGSNYAFVDGHVAWYAPAKPKYYMATDGLDYDGNGTLGDRNMLR